MSNLLRRSAGFTGILISGLMIITGCGSGAAPTATTAPPTATTKPAPTTAVATAVPTATQAGPTATPAIAATANNSSNTVSQIQNTLPKYTADQVKQGGTWHASINNDPACFNPYCASTGVSPPMFLITHQKLIRYKAVQYPEYAKWGSGVFAGDIVDTWDVSDGGKTYTLHLRQGANWPALNNVGGVTLPARPIVADDVLFSWDRMKNDTTSVVRSFYASQVSQTAPDDHTVVAKTDQPYADWIGTTYANGETQFVIRRDFVEKLGTQYGLGFESMWGSGSFSPSKSTQGSEYNFVRNPSYAFPGYPHVDAVQDIIIKDTATAQAAGLAGKLETITSPTLADAQRWKSQDPDVVIFRGEALAHNPIGMQWNVSTGPGADAAARQAVSKLFPWEGMIKDLFAGDGAYTGCIPSGFVSVSQSQDDLKKLYFTDAAAAKDLLTKAGYTKDKPFNFDSFADPASTTPFAQATLLQAAVEATGIAHMNIKSTPFNQSRAQVIAGAFTSAWQPLSSGTVTKIFNAFYGGGAQGPMGSQNYMKLNDPEVNTWYEKQSVDFDTADRAKIIQAFITKCAQQAYVLPMPTPPSYTTVHGWVKNFGYNDFYLDENRTVWLWIDRTGFPS